jgi:hypothetical protein
MSKQKTITLQEPIEGPSGQITQVVLREPKWPDVMELGEPAAYARSDGGMVYSADKDDVIHAYVQRLMVEPQDRLLLIQVGLADTLQLREAVFSFFQAARKAISLAS